MLNRLRTGGALPAALLLAAAAFALWWAGRFIPLRHWLFFRCLGLWALVALFGAASWAAGLRLLRRLLPQPARLDERLLWGFGLGVLLFLAPLALWASGAAIRFRWFRPLLVWGATALAVWSAHWAKNWLFYGDPSDVFIAESHQPDIYRAS